MKPFRFALLLALGTWGLTAPAAGSTCTMSSIVSGCSSDVALFSTLPGAKDGLTGELEPWSAGQPCPTGCYDLIHGRFEASGDASVYGPCGSGVSTDDNYQVVGPGAGVRTFEAVLQIESTISGACGVFAQLHAAPSGPTAEVQFSESGARELVLALTASPGEDFRLSVSFSVAGLAPTPEGVSSAVATLRFRGLPAGDSVVSCQQYALPVPAAIATWGGVKALYR